MRARWVIQVTLYTPPWGWWPGLERTSDWHRLAWWGPVSVEWWREPGA